MTLAYRVRLSATGFMMAGVVAACGGDDRTPVSATRATTAAGSVASAECVQLAVGGYYWDGTHFVVSPSADHGDDSGSAGGSGLALARPFSELGFSWLGQTLNGRVATLSGKAPDLRARDRAFEAGSKIFRDTTQRDDLIIVDAIQLGNSPGPGEGVASLISTGKTIRACQEAFNRTMRVRHCSMPSAQRRNCAIPMPSKLAATLTLPVRMITIWSCRKSAPTRCDNI
jgi:hypothetical protein